MLRRFKIRILTLEAFGSYSRVQMICYIFALSNFPVLEFNLKFILVGALEVHAMVVIWHAVHFQSYTILTE